MNRIAIFAHYDSNNSIQNYVIYYLEQLSKFFSTIVFVSDSDISAKEQKKIDAIVDVCIAKRHGEYDFGSYKIGFNYLLTNNLLKDADEIVFVNDSCYGPLFDLENVFNKMESLNLDFWGLSANYSSIKQNKHHVQSFFIAFSSQVFLSDTFQEFIFNVKKEKNKIDIVLNYELGLTSYLEKAHFKWDVYSNISKIAWDSYLYDYDRLILEEQFPLLKRSIVLNREAIFVPISKIINLISHNTKYPIDYIKQDLSDNKQKQKIKVILKRLKIYITKCIKRLYYKIRYRKVYSN